MSIKIKTDEFQKDNSEMLEKVAEKILKKHIIAFKELAKWWNLIAKKLFTYKNLW